ncbi:DUF6544 family protein [Amaricoccus tamworthensis]|uniref:DUF6544 family protein n=1 Tax=Amaricoccus tamworthensis TaxID=57002 RepID=UPI003C7D5029
MIAILVLVALGTAGLVLLRLRDARADRAEWARLAGLQPKGRAVFSAEMVADLPEPARRFFRFAIAEGARLRPVVELRMTGRMGLGTKENPGYQPIEAEEILAAPEGFVWSVRTRGGMAVSGSDSGKWTRFWLLGLIPVARVGGDADHTRSAFGRYVAEAVFWSPAAVLPRDGVTWAAVDAETARVTVRHGDLEQAVDVSVDAEGRPVEVAFDRWTNANPEKAYRLQRFGGYMSDFREVEGYRLPHHVEAGNLFGTEGYFPFFIVDVVGVRFPGTG